ncbi:MULTISPECIES: glycosyltransferase [Streptacidiphilus]|uniref:Glycosyltransferase n=1 Tax=Streptacidiphilus cavernicola TaxID=3342716 RepID=A0ABV6UX44_9ACTN|nr:glycosyltransferase [Streptacidiphilus jeojiense]
MIELTRALRARGASVRVATHGGVHEGLLRAAGIDYDVIGTPMNRERGTEFVRSAVGLGPVDQSMYTDDEMRSYVQAEAEYFRTHGVTVAVTGFTLTALLSTRLTGTRLVTEHAGSWVPPVFERGLLPAPSQVQGALRVVPRSVLRRIINRRLPRLRYYCSGFQRIAAELGVEGVPSLPALLMGDVTLVPEIPEVVGIPAQELEAWSPRGKAAYRQGASLRYTGPLYAHLDLPLPARVEQFLDGPGPVVYVALTSTGPDLIRRTVAGLRGLGVRILVAGIVHDLADLADLDGRDSDSGDGVGQVMVDSVLPSHLVMPRVDLAVVTGGQGSVQTAMASGTPVLGIPLQLEQDLNVALLERLGAARRIAPRDCAGPKLAALARQLLGHDSYRQAAARIKRLYDAVDGPGRAADAIIETAALGPVEPAAGRAVKLST